MALFTVDLQDPTGRNVSLALVSAADCPGIVTLMSFPFSWKVRLL